MPTEIINLVKGDSAGSDTDYRDALPVNMTAVVREMFGVRGYMIQYPGLTQLGSLTGVCRGGIWNERFIKHFRINGTQFSELDKDGIQTILGTVTGTDTVSLAYSFNTQSIVANGNWYLYDETNGFRQISDENLGTPIDHTWIDNYYFFTDGENIYHTTIGDESVIEPLGFATAEFTPDPTLGVSKTQDDKAVVFDRYSTQYFTNTGSEGFAFQWLKARTIKKGIVGTHCKTEMDGVFYVLGGGKEEKATAYTIGVGSTQKIATREVEKIIDAYSEEELSKSVVESYAEFGYQYILYHLPNDTLIFNKTLAQQSGANQAWTILKTNDFDNYRAIHYVNDVRLNKWTVGDKLNGTIGILDSLVATQYDELCQWELYSPFYELETASVDEIAIEVLPGFNDQGDATVSMSITKDGVNFSKNYFALYGSEQNYNNRLIRRRLGNINHWCGFKIRGKTRSRMAFNRASIIYG